MADTDKAVENWKHYEHARDSGHIAFVKKYNACRRYFLGKHWEESQRAILEAQGRPVLTINKVFSTLITVMGEQVATQADISFQPTASGNDESATALSKLWLNIARSNNFAMVEEAVFDSGAISSRGFFDVRINFDDNMRGEVRLKKANAKNVIIDPTAEEYDPRTWKETFYTKWLSLNDIGLTYGDAAMRELKSRSRSNFEWGYDSIDTRPGTFGFDPDLNRYKQYNSAGYKDDNLVRDFRIIERQHKQVRTRPHFVDLASGDTRIIPETWEHNRIAFIAEQYQLGVIQKKTEQIKWTVSVDDVLLFDNWSPYKWFTQIPYFPVFFEGQTIGLVENLLSPQDQLNKASSQELHIVNTTANSGWKVAAGALQNMDEYELEQRGAETGLVVVLDDVNNLEKITPNTVPTGLDRVAFKADENIKDLSGVSDSVRGFDRADVAAKAIRAKQQAGSVNLTKAFRNLLHTRHLVASSVLDLVQTYYTEERIIKVNGNGLLSEPEEITLNQTTPEGDVVNDLQTGEYEVVVTDVPKRETFEQGQFDEATRLRELGVAIPDDVLIDSSQLSNKADIAQRIREANGDADPTEIQQQLAQLELQKAELDNELVAAEVMKKKADASLALVQAQGEAIGQQQDEGAEAQAAKIAMDAEVAQATLMLKRDETQAMLQIKREELQEEMALKRELQRENMRLERAKAEIQLELLREKARVDAEATETKAAAQVDAIKAKEAAKPKESSNAGTN